MNQQGEESDEEASFGCSEDHEESEVNSPENHYFFIRPCSQPQDPSSCRLNGQRPPLPDVYERIVKSPQEHQQEEEPPHFKRARHDEVTHSSS